MYHLAKREYVLFLKACLHVGSHICFQLWTNSSQKYLIIIASLPSRKGNPWTGISGLVLSPADNFPSEVALETLHVIIQAVQISAEVWTGLQTLIPRMFWCSWSISCNLEVDHVLNHSFTNCVSEMKCDPGSGIRGTSPYQKVNCWVSVAEGPCSCQTAALALDTLVVWTSLHPEP